MLFGKGHLRNIRYDGQEMLGMIYFAVRDADWETLENKIENLTIRDHDGILRIDFECLCQSAGIDFRWRCRIEVAGQDITFEIRGKAHSDFQRNRIGFCVLHSLQYKSKEVVVTHSDGTETIERFPENVAPWQPVKDIQKMQWSGQNIGAALSFEGDVFEMEDQRNWSDAYFKTYSTPLERPFPVLVKAGDEVYQKIECRFDEKKSRVFAVRSEKFELKITDKKSIIPHLGLETNEEKLDNFAVEKLKSLNLSHLRVEAQTHQSDWLLTFCNRVSQARQLGLPIELIIFVERWGSKNLELIKKELAGIEIISILPINIHEKATSDIFLKGIIPIINLLFPNVPIGGGTDFYFAEYNRVPPPSELIDFVSFSVNPQVHAFDDLTLVENNQALGDMVQTARLLSARLPVHMSPITLKPRKNLDKTNEDEKTISQSNQADARHSTHFNALWTLGCFKQLAQANAQHLTFFQTVGARGLIDKEISAEQNLSAVKTYKVFPVFDLFKAVSYFKNGRIIHSISTHPTIFEGLILKNKDYRWCLVANYTTNEIEISIETAIYSIPPISLTQIEL